MLRARAPAVGRSGSNPEAPVTLDTEIELSAREHPARAQVSGVGFEKRKTRPRPCVGREASPALVLRREHSRRRTARTLETERRESREERKDAPLTRALRSHQLWLTLTYFALLILMARGLAG